MNLRVLFLSLTLAVVLAACSDADVNSTGSEYMPDMAHSVAVEANTYNYYYYNTWDDRSTIPLGELVYPKYTVEGTVPRGYAGSYLPGEQAPQTLDEAESMRGSIVDGDNLNAFSVPTNGHVPYYYEDTPEGRERAIAELVDNPFPITTEGMVRGANIYNIFCAICHGAQGNGLGPIYDTEQNPQAVYPLAPANFLRDEFYEATNGRYYHAIMKGYNVMGAYADKMNYEERWQVIHYIRRLQAKELGLEYSELANTAFPEAGTPLAEFDPRAAVQPEQIENAVREGVSEQLTERAGAGGPAPGNTLRKKK